MKVGRLFGLSIINGGPGPTFLPPCVMDYLFGRVDYGRVTMALKDVLDSLIERKIRQACSLYYMTDVLYKSTLHKIIVHCIV